MNTRCNGHSNVNAPGDLRLDARHAPQAQRHTHLERASLGLKSVRCVQWPQPGRRSAGTQQRRLGQEGCVDAQQQRLGIVGDWHGFASEKQV